MEREQRSKIAFLDVLVERKSKSFVTSVYRKPTHTNRYINFASYHHPRTKTGVISCLRKRADEICQPHLKTTEINHLRKAFEANGYPRKVIGRTMHQRGKEPRNDQEEPQEKPKVLYLPYVRNTSEEIERECKKLGVKVVSSSGTLRQTLMKMKTPREDMKKKDVVYEVPCMDCGIIL